jgi:hypothetical protein
MYSDAGDFFYMRSYEMFLSYFLLLEAVVIEVGGHVFPMNFLYHFSHTTTPLVF